MIFILFRSKKIYPPARIPGAARKLSLALFITCNFFFMRLLYAFVFLLLFTACSGPKDPLPAVPAGIASVQGLLKGKEFRTVKTGFYDALTINDKPTAEWIDTAVLKDNIQKTVVREQGGFGIDFLTDTSATVHAGGRSQAATYVLDTTITEFDKGAAGIKLRLTYEDASMSFSLTDEPMKVTYTFLVKGVDEKYLLLQLPREINRRSVISLLKARQ